MRKSRIKNSESGIFSRFPIDILRVILQYLATEEICVLDSAILHHASRSIFLESLQGLKLGNGNGKLRGPSAIRWLLKRKVALPHLTIHAPTSRKKSTYQEDCYQLISQNKDLLQSIDLKCSTFSLRFFEVFKLCRNLTSVNFHGCQFGETKFRMFLSSNIPLKSLDLTNCSQLTKKSITLLTEKYHQIQQLNLNFLDFISDPQVTEIISGCPLIRRLGLSGTPITDVSVESLLQAYPHMEILEVEYCPRLSLEGILSTKIAIIRRLQHRSDASLQLIAASTIRAVLYYRHLSADQLAALGSIPYLIQYLEKDDSPVLQEDAMFSLNFIVSVSNNQTAGVIALNAIPKIVNLLSSQTKAIFQQAVLALGNIVGESATHRDLVLSHGVFDTLLSTIEKRYWGIDSEIILQRDLTWAIANFCRHKPHPIIPNFNLCFPFLLRQLIRGDLDCQQEVGSALTYFTNDNNGNIQLVLDAGFLPIILNLLWNCHHEKLKSIYLQIIGNILTGNDIQTQHVLNLGILSLYFSLLQQKKERYYKTICWSIANIAIGTELQTQTILNSKLLSLILPLCYDSNISNEIREECLWCFCNSTKHRLVEHMEYLINLGILSLFHWCLDSSRLYLVERILASIFDILTTNGTKYHSQVRKILERRLQEMFERNENEENEELKERLEDIKRTLLGLGGGDVNI